MAAIDFVSTRGPERIGSFRLIKTLGKGHACEIWEVERGTDGQRWAMKLLLPGQYFTRDNLASLRHEYVVGHALQHPNIIRTLEHNHTADGAFILQELFRGPNLKQIIQQGGGQRVAHLLPDILRQAAESLAYLHSRGWIHRDVKPDNFLVDDAGQVKLIDFNIAQRQQGMLGRLLPSWSGKVQGTQSYMSPEQIRGQRCDWRSDIYGLGCTIHELVGGKPPFTGVSTQELLTKHLKSKPPSLLMAEPNVTAEFAALVQRMINKDPAARPASMSDVVSALGSTQVYRIKPKPPPAAGQAAP